MGGTQLGNVEDSFGMRVTSSLRVHDGKQPDFSSNLCTAASFSAKSVAIFENEEKKKRHLGLPHHIYQIPEDTFSTHRI